MSSDDEDAVPYSEACPSDDARNSPNATDEEATPSQYKKTQRDDEDDADEYGDANDDEENEDDDSMPEFNTSQEEEEFLSRPVVDLDFSLRESNKK